MNRDRDGELINEVHADCDGAQEDRYRELIRLAREDQDALTREDCADMLRAEAELWGEKTGEAAELRACADVIIEQGIIVTSEREKG